MTVTRAIDPLDRVTAIDSPDAALDTTYTYDDATVYKIACSLLALFMVISACGDCTSRWPKEPFDRKEWIASPQTRFRYVRDLLEAKRLQQLSKAEVLELLGPPAFAPASGNFVEYVVAIKESEPFSLGTVVVLTIEFDANGVVSNQHLRAE